MRTVKALRDFCMKLNDFEWSFTSLLVIIKVSDYLLKISFARKALNIWSDILKTDEIFRVGPCIAKDHVDERVF